MGEVLPRGPRVREQARGAERRLVSVLFVDLTGYTSLCEERDAEDVHALVRPLMEELRDLCRANGAYVPLIAGDGFMAVFGVPLAREDDPFRALVTAAEAHSLVRARRAQAPDLPPLHTGLHLGEAVVEQRGENEWALSGDVVNVASRLCSTAGPDELLASQDLITLTGVDEGWESSRSVPLRGKSSDVTSRAYAWTRSTPRVRSRDIGGAYLPRTDLEEAIRAAVANDGGALVLGEAGHGKSRVVAKALEGKRSVVVSCAPLLHPEVRDLLAELVAASPEAPAGLVDLLSGARAVEGENSGGDELLAAGARALQGLPEDTVVVLDDAERLPPTEWVRLRAVMQRSDRPWLVVSRADHGGLGLLQIHVPPLTAEQARACVEALLPGCSNELVDLVTDRGGGSPLFLEQCARLLVESGAVRQSAGGYELVDRTRLGAIPTSMRQFITSRLDLLPDQERMALHVASVLGEVVDVALLRTLVGADLAHEPLVERGLLVAQPGRDEQELRFAHALVRDVAYEGMLKTRRIEIHRAAAEWYAVLPTSQVLEARAHHLEASVRLGGADCALVRETVEAMVFFARAVEVERTVVAHDVVRRARALVESRPECQVETMMLDLAEATVRLLIGDHSASVLSAAQAADRARALMNEPARAEALLLQGRALALNEPERAGALLDESEAVFTALDDLSGVAKVVLERGVLTHRHAGLVPYIELMSRAYQLAMRSGDARLRAVTAQRLAVISAIALGRNEYEPWAEQARAVSRADDISLEPHLELAQALLGWQSLDPSTGMAPSARALRAGRELGLAFIYRNAALGRLYILIFAGRLAEARELLAEAREYALTESTTWMTLQLDLIEARISLREGEVADAERLLAAVAADPATAQRGMARDLAEFSAAVAMERGHFEEARRLAAEALAIDERIGETCNPLRPRLTLIVSALAGGHGVPLSEMSALRQGARDTGLLVIDQLARRWVLVDELAHGFTADTHGIEPVDVPEARALDLEIQALSTRDWTILVRAAEAWAELGITVWHARALLWHSELTGTASPRADELLRVLGSPPDLGEFFRGQVRDLLS